MTKVWGLVMIVFTVFMLVCAFGLCLCSRAHNDISDNSVLPTLWQQFWEGPSCFSMTMPRRTKPAPWRNGFSLFGLACTEPWPQSHRKLVGWIETLTVSEALIAQHQWETSLMLLWLNGSKSLQPDSKSMWRTFPERGAHFYLWSEDKMFTLRL